MWENKGGSNQQWEFTGDGYIVSRHNNMVLDIPKAEYANKVHVCTSLQLKNNKIFHSAHYINLILTRML